MDHCDCGCSDEPIKDPFVRVEFDAEELRNLTILRDLYRASINHELDDSFSDLVCGFNRLLHYRRAILAGFYTDYVAA